VSGGAITTSGGAVSTVTTTGTLTTNSDKTGYALSTAGNKSVADSVWDADSTGATANAATVGRALAQSTKTSITAIKTKTDYLPSVIAGGNGGLFIAGTNDHVVVTGNATVTGNLVVSGTTTHTGNVLYSGSVTATNAANDIRGIALTVAGNAAVADAAADSVWDTHVTTVANRTVTPSGGTITRADSLGLGGVQAIFKADSTTYALAAGTMGKAMSATGSAAGGITEAQMFSMLDTASVIPTITQAGLDSLSTSARAIKVKTDSLMYAGVLTNPSFLRPTTAGRALDVTSGGNAGVDWANVESPATAVNLASTIVGTANVLSASGVDAIWDEPTNHQTTNTYGKMFANDSVAIKAIRDSMQYAAQTAASSLDSGIVTRIVKRSWGIGGTVENNDSLTTAQRNITVGTFSATAGKIVADSVRDIIGDSLTVVKYYIKGLADSTRDIFGDSLTVVKYYVKGLADSVRDVVGDSFNNVSGAVTLAPIAGKLVADSVRDIFGDSLTVVKYYVKGLADSVRDVIGDTFNVVSGEVIQTQASADKAWGTSARVLTAGTNIALAKGTGLTGLNDIAATAIVSGGAITTSSGKVSNVATVDSTGKVGAVILSGTTNITAISGNTDAANRLANLFVDSAGAKTKLYGVLDSTRGVSTVGSVGTVAVVDTVLKKVSATATATLDSAAIHDIAAAVSASSVVNANVVAINGDSTNGYNATLKLKMLDISNSSGIALSAVSTGNGGTGAYFASTGSSGTGFYASGDSRGMLVTGTDGTGLIITGTGSLANGISIGHGTGGSAIKLGTNGTSRVAGYIDSTLKAVNAGTVTIPDSLLAVHTLADGIKAKTDKLTYNDQDSLIIDYSSIPPSIVTLPDSTATQITNIQGLVSGLSAITGSGAYACTLFVRDAGTAVQGVTVRANNSTETATAAQGLTNSNGRVIFNLDAAQYKVRTYISGLTQTTNPQTVTVISAGAHDTIQVSTFNPGAPTTPSLTRVYGNVQSVMFSAVGATVKARLQAPNNARLTSDSTIISPYEVTAAVDSVTGAFHIDLIPNSLITVTNAAYNKYTFSIYKGGFLVSTKKDVVVPVASPYKLAF
jgi:hypothetical protein